MSIDIVSYTNLSTEILQKKIELIKSNSRGVFYSAYTIYDVKDILNRQQLNLIEDRVEKYQKETKLLIAEEFGLEDPRSYFSIAVNDKTFSEVTISEIADILRKELGPENIIILLNGEDLI